MRQQAVPQATPQSAMNFSNSHMMRTSLPTRAAAPYCGNRSATVMSGLYLTHLPTRNKAHDRNPEPEPESKQTPPHSPP